MVIDCYNKKMDQLTICIPRVETHITKEYISKKFDKLKLGDILQITDVPLKMDSDYKRVFIKMRWKPVTTQGEFIYKRLAGDENVKFVYDDPWYWKIVKSR
jgi:hypothetical protein